MAPETCNVPATEEEALEIKPPAKVERFSTLNVEEAEIGAETCKGPEIVDDPVMMAPFPTVSMPVVEALDKVVCPVTLKLEERIVAPSTVKVPYNLELPPTNKVLEALSCPETLKSEETVEEDVERKPFAKEASPERLIAERLVVPVAVMFPTRAL